MVGGNSSLAALFPTKAKTLKGPMNLGFSFPEAVFN